MNELTELVPNNVNVPLLEFLVNICLCIVTSFMLRYVYVRRSISLSGKYHIGNIIPILAIVTFMVIMVVKSSLALSLGLVGALSIVRFRTPIKEPEELVYLFIAIALGLGYGAAQLAITTIAFLILLAVIYFWLSRTPTNKRDEYNLLISWTDKDISIDNFTEIITRRTDGADLLKYSHDPLEQSLYMKVHLSELKSIKDIKTAVLEISPSAKLSFYEARPLQ